MAFIPLFLVQVLNLLPSRTESALSAALLTPGYCPVVDKHTENILLPHVQPVSTQLIYKSLFLILRLITICKKPFISLPNFPKQPKKHNFPLFLFHLISAIWTHWRKSCPSAVLASYSVCHLLSPWLSSSG